MNKLKNIDIAILCGGLGKRLRPAIGESQKVMANVNDEPFLNILFRSIAIQGGKRVILLTGYKAETVEEYYKKNSFGLAIDFSREASPLGTGGALKNARSLIKTDPFMMMNGDSFCAVDFLKLLKFHRSQKALATIVVREIEDAKDYGSITLNAQKEIVGFEEKAKGGKAYINAGVYCFNNGIFGLMPKDNAFFLERDFFPGIAGNRFFGFVVNNEFIDVGVPHRYEKAKKIFKAFKAR